MSGESNPAEPNAGLRVLLAGGSQQDAEQLRGLFAASRAMQFELVHVEAMSEIVSLADAKRADILLLYFDADSLPRMDHLTQARLAAPQLPVVVFSDIDDEAVALRALHNGARGFVVKHDLSSRLLVTTVGAALESHRMILQLDNAREQARHLATHDQLTGLANRALFHDRLEQALTTAKRSHQKLALLFLDLDGFKAINDTLGHAVGDGLLRGIARRVASCLRETDFAGRLGGDEFGVLLTNLGSELDAATVARKLIAEISEPLEFRNQSISIHGSVGISTFPGDGVDAEELLKKADVAMYHAKERGGARFDFYTEDMNAAILERQALEENLRTVLDDDGLVLHYQPQYDLSRGRIIGAEALLRWQHPERGLLSPVHFLPILEETGLIVPVGDWVLRKACEQNAQWIAKGHRGLRISVNVASQQFLENGFASAVASVLDSTGLPPVCLELEITESSLLRDVDVTVNTLHNLKQQGVRLAIDDFGTGYSALAYLKRLPIDVLKIDQSFVRTLCTDPADATITEAIVQLAAGLNLSTIAEGVETLEQLLLLGSYGCTRMQGYLFGKPVPAQVFEKWLDDPPFRWMQGEPIPAADATGDEDEGLSAPANKARH